MNRHKFDDVRWGVPLSTACIKAAATALSVNGAAASPDVIETVGERFAECARCYSPRLKLAGLDDSVLVSAVHFVADMLTPDEAGSGEQWFEASLDAVLELAAPSAQLTPEAWQFVATVARQLAS